MVALAGKDAQIYMTGASTSMTGEAMSDAGDTTTYQIDDATKDIFDPATTMVVSDSNGTVAVADYTIRYLVGVVEFDTAPTDPVTIDGAYLPKYPIFEGYEQSVEITRELFETTQFQDDGVRRGAVGALEMSGDFSMNKALEELIDGSGGSEDTLREILLGTSTHSRTGSVDRPRVYRAQPNDTATDTLISSWVKFADESLDASVGSKQERTFSMEAAKQDSTMSSQTAKVADIFANSEI